MSFWSKIFNSHEISNGAQKYEQTKLPPLSVEEKQKVTEKIKRLEQQIKSAEFSTAPKEQQANDLTELGQNYQKLNQIDDAIRAYEKSLQCNEDFGPAFDGLLSLYDVKRQAAAYAKNNDDIQKWLNKSDELTALSKKIMRSR